MPLRASLNRPGNPGHAIDVLDSEGAAVGASTSLAPANSVKMFRLEGISGWHTVIVEYPAKAAMNNATVAMRLREPDSGVSIEHVPSIEHCAPTRTKTRPPGSNLVIRNAQALLWPQTCDWRATVVNIGDAAAAPTTVQVRGLETRGVLHEIDTKTIDREIAAGAEWRMSDFIPSGTQFPGVDRLLPSVGDVVRICVSPVPGEADSTNNCASATVEKN